MERRLRLISLLAALVLLAACGGSKALDPTPVAVDLGDIQLNAHPSALQGKTVVLRWNSKVNGDKFLNRLAELLIQQVDGIKVVKAWEADPLTAVLSESVEDSKEVTDRLLALDPDLLITAQADGNKCSRWTMIDQLNAELAGVPTVIIATSAFAKYATEAAAEQGIDDFAMAVVPHPIAGHDQAGVEAKVDAAFPEILKAATEWQPK